MFAPLQEPKHPDLEVFFNIEFDRTGNPNNNIESISRFSCSYALNLIANNCNQKINHNFPMKETVKLNHLSTPFQVDF